MDICMLCKSSLKDDIRYGDFLKNKKFGVHTFCLYLSSNLAQNGNDDEGFLGFLESDIRTEVQRIKPLKCCYCGKGYANIGCCEKRCHRVFHLICGIANNAENRFCRDYRSYCNRHTRKVRERPSASETCLICFENLCAAGEKFNRVSMILTPCCRNGWFHKLCLQRFAKTAGYFFKCPLCNDANVFREKLPAKGIFIPNQDAAWELEPNAFAELLERPNKCAAERCKNRNGRQTQSDTNPFIMCHACGSIAIHKLCLPTNGKQFNCSDCSIANEDRDSGRESLNSHANHNEDEYIDVCHVSDKEDLEIINRLIATSSRIIENKRDSGTKMDTDSSDEDIPQTSRKNRFVASNKILDTDTESDGPIKPSHVKQQVRRLVLESECSESQEEVYEKNKKSNFINQTKSSIASVSDSDEQPDLLKAKGENFNTFIDTEQFESEEEEIQIIGKRKSFIIESETVDNEFYSPKQKRLKSTTTEKKAANNESNIFNDESSEGIDSDRPIKPSTVQQVKRLVLGSECSESQEVITARDKKSNFNNQTMSSIYSVSDCDNQTELLESEGDNFNTLIDIKQLESEEEPIQLSGRRKSFIIQSDTEENEFFSPNQKHLNINTEKEMLHKETSIFNDDSDSDPVENFIEMVKKKPSSQANQAKNEKSEQTRNRKFAKLKENNNLDISCIAKRTRRKTISSESSNQSASTNENREKENPLNTSCIALRTRRKTICGRTDFNKNTDFEMSQIYEKVHFSNESLQTITETEENSEKENCSKTNSTYEDENSEQESSICYINSKVSDLENFIVEDGYDEKDSKFDISCIANRTRKRKSLKQQSLSRIVEVSDDCSSESSEPSNMIINSYKGRKRSSYRINSYSSEDFEVTPSSRRTKHMAFANIEKCPVQDFTTVLRTIKRSHQSTCSS